MGVRVLVGCETSGVVRRAFADVGIEAWSCDLLASEDNDPRHIVGDVREVVTGGGPWDLGIFHPPCTDLASSGARWMAEKGEEVIEESVDLLRWLLAYQRVVPRVCIENPIGVASTRMCLPSQIVQPWWFGHGETKATCLWLRNLPVLRATKVVAGRADNVHFMGQTADRWRKRSRTFEGLGHAMATQWGGLLLEK